MIGSRYIGLRSPRTCSGSVIAPKKNDGAGTGVGGAAAPLEQAAVIQQPDDLPGQAVRLVPLVDLGQTFEHDRMRARELQLAGHEHTYRPSADDDDVKHGKSLQEARGGVVNRGGDEIAAGSVGNTGGGVLA